MQFGLFTFKYYITTDILHIKDIAFNGKIEKKFLLKKQIFWKGNFWYDGLKFNGNIN